MNKAIGTVLRNTRLAARRDADFTQADYDAAVRAELLVIEFIAMIERLLPYARLEAERHAERGGDGGETESVIDAAESLLAQIEGLTDQSTEQRG